MTVDEPTRFAPVADSRPVDGAWPAMVWPPPADLRLRGTVVELVRFDPDADATELFESLDHDDVWRHVAGRPTDAASLAATLVASTSLGRVPWTLRLLRPYAGLHAGAVVGTSSFLDASVPDARVEIGSTTYAPRVWATDVNPDAKLLLLGLAFEVLGAGRVQLKTDVRNHRSQQAIARLGARHEGTLRRYQRRGDGTVRDTALFSIVAEEWPAVRRRLVARLEAR